MNGSTVYTTSVAPSSSIADRAAQLADGIIAEQQQQPQQRQSFDTTSSSSSSSSSSSEPTTQPQPVNIIAHSLGGLDARYMISRLKHPAIRVASLTTIATPHRGSPVADYFVEKGAGPIYLPRLYGLIERTGLGTEAFEQLSTRFLTTEFNPATPDLAGVRYFSYGADIGGKPPLLSLFRFPHGLIARREGANDGLVSVESSRWGEYQGTLDGVGHLDLINWSNRMRWALKQWVGFRKTFNAVAFYLGIADMLAKEGC
jgi:triacylglycerol lipase